MKFRKMMGCIALGLTCAMIGARPIKLGDSSYSPKGI